MKAKTWTLWWRCAALSVCSPPLRLAMSPTLDERSCNIDDEERDTDDDMSEIRPPASLELLLAMYKKDLNHIWVFACLNPSSDKGVCPEPGPTDDKSMEGARALCAMLCNTDLNPCVRVPTPHDAYGLG